MDVCNWLFKGMPVRASGFGGQAVQFQPPGRNILDHYSLSFDYGKNKQVSSSHSWLSGRNAHISGIQIAILGSKATLDLLKGLIYPCEFDREKDVPETITKAELVRDGTPLEMVWQNEHDLLVVIPADMRDIINTVVRLS